MNYNSRSPLTVCGRENIDIYDVGRFAPTDVGEIGRSEGLSQQI